MPTSFLLRFQESFLEGDEAPSIQCGTRTETRTYGEQGDPDPGPGGYRTLPLSAGTQTKTGAHGEGPDADPNHCSFRVIPQIRPIVATSTTTATYVRAEADDKDPWERRWQAIPRQF